MTCGGWADILKWFPVSLLFIGMLSTSVVAFKHCSLGTIVVVRMISPLIGLLVETSFREFDATVHTFLSVWVIVLGVAIYGVFQERVLSESIGILLTVVNMFIGTFFRLAQRYLMVESPVAMNDLALMLYNSISCLVAVPGLMLLTNEWTPSSLDNFKQLTPAGWGYVAFSGVIGVLISYFELRAQRRISATSFLIAGNMVKVFVIIFGIIFLGETLAPLSGLGAALGIVGAAYYTWDRNVSSTRSSGDRSSSFGFGFTLIGKRAKIHIPDDESDETSAFIEPHSPDCENWNPNKLQRRFLAPVNGATA